MIDTDVCFISSLQTRSVCCELLSVELILEPIIQSGAIPSNAFHNTDIPPWS